jgi:hypothetical protein
MSMVTIGDGTRELLTFTEDGSAVNHVNIENQATGGPIISAAGDDTNIDLVLSTKGSGKVGINNTGLEVTGGDITTNVTASRAVVTDASSNLSASATTSTELGYVSGVTSAIQTQINGKIGDVVDDTTPQLGGQLDVNGNAIGDGTRELLTLESILEGSIHD